MDFFSDDPHSVVNPRERVMAFSPSRTESVGRIVSRKLALITFTSHDLQGLIQWSEQAKPMEAWRSRGSASSGERWGQRMDCRSIPLWSAGHCHAIGRIGCLWGEEGCLSWYCGAIKEGIGIGDIVLPSRRFEKRGHPIITFQRERRAVRILRFRIDSRIGSGGIGLPLVGERSGQRMRPIERQPRRSEGIVQKVSWGSRWRWLLPLPLER